MNAPLVDVLLNTAFAAQYTLFRRFIQSVLGPAGSPFAKWGISQATSNTQNFKIDGGEPSLIDGAVGSDLTSEGPARFFLGGHMALLKGDKNWRDNVTTRPVIHSQITAVSGGTVTDTSAFFGLDSDTLVDRPFFPDLTNTSGDDSGPLGFKISSVQDENTLVLNLSAPINQDGTAASFSPTPSTLEDFGAVAGNFYRIGVTTPAAGTRIDTVVLDVYEDEASSDDDAIVKRSISGTVTESANALVVRQRIEVLEGVNAAESPAPFGQSPLFYDRRTDHDGNVHHRVALATLSRTSGTNTISTADITNLEASTNDVWALTFGSLPPTVIDAAIIDANSAGVSTEAGKYGGTTVEIGRLLLQMLGNVSGDQNAAFQNMGDHVNSVDAVTAGVPGVGSSSYPGDGRHLALLTNEEHGALLNASGITRSDAATDNNVITKQGHAGGSSAVNDGLHSGATTSHAVASGAAVVYQGDIGLLSTVVSNNDSFTLGETVIAMGTGFTDWEITDVNGMDKEISGLPAAIPEDTDGTVTNVGIPISGISLGLLTTESAIRARYSVVAMGGMCGSTTGGGQTMDNIIRCNGWSVVSGQLSVRFDVSASDSQRVAAWGSIFLVSK
jgi:hypothetical protein